MVLAAGSIKRDMSPRCFVFDVQAFACRQCNPNKCQGLPNENQLRAFLIAAQTSGGTVGGLFGGSAYVGGGSQS